MSCMSSSALTRITCSAFIRFCTWRSHASCRRFLCCAAAASTALWSFSAVAMFRLLRSCARSQGVSECSTPLVDRCACGDRSAQQTSVARAAQDWGERRNTLPRGGIHDSQQHPESGLHSHGCMLTWQPYGTSPMLKRTQNHAHSTHPGTHLWRQDFVKIVLGGVIGEDTALWRVRRRLQSSPAGRTRASALGAATSPWSMVMSMAAQRGGAGS